VKDFEKEKNELERLAQGIYDKWLKIKEIRKTNKYQSSQYELKVY
jgi:hypothetical protein